MDRVLGPCSQAGRAQFQLVEVGLVAVHIRRASSTGGARPSGHGFPGFVAPRYKRRKSTCPVASRSPHPERQRNRDVVMPHGWVVNGMLVALVTVADSPRR